MAFLFRPFSTSPTTTTTSRRVVEKQLGIPADWLKMTSPYRLKMIGLKHDTTVAVLEKGEPSFRVRGKQESAVKACLERFESLKSQNFQHPVDFLIGTISNPTSTITTPSPKTYQSYELLNRLPLATVDYLAEYSKKEEEILMWTLNEESAPKISNLIKFWAPVLKDAELGQNSAKSVTIHPSFRWTNNSMISTVQEPGKLFFFHGALINLQGNIWGKPDDVSYVTNLMTKKIPYDFVTPMELSMKFDDKELFGVVQKTVLPRLFVEGDASVQLQAVKDNEIVCLTHLQPSRILKFLSHELQQPMKGLTYSDSSDFVNMRIEHVNKTLPQVKVSQICMTLNKTAPRTYCFLHGQGMDRDQLMKAAEVFNVHPYPFTETVSLKLENSLAADFGILQSRLKKFLNFSGVLEPLKGKMMDPKGNFLVRTLTRDDLSSFREKWNKLVGTTVPANPNIVLDKSKFCYEIDKTRRQIILVGLVEDVKQLHASIAESAARNAVAVQPAPSASPDNVSISSAKPPTSPVAPNLIIKKEPTIARTKISPVIEAKPATETTKVINKASIPVSPSPQPPAAVSSAPPSPPVPDVVVNNLMKLESSNKDLLLRVAFGFNKERTFSLMKSSNVGIDSIEVNNNGISIGGKQKVVEMVQRQISQKLEQANNYISQKTVMTITSPDAIALVILGKNDIEKQSRAVIRIDGDRIEIYGREENKMSAQKALEVSINMAEKLRKFEHADLDLFIREDRGFLKHITEKTGARIIQSPDTTSLKYYGSVSQMDEAEKMLKERFANWDSYEARKFITLPGNIVGLVIGKQAQNLSTIEKETGVSKIAILDLNSKNIANKTSTIIIEGAASNVQAAEKLLNERISSSAEFHKKNSEDRKAPASPQQQQQQQTRTPSPVPRTHISQRNFKVVEVPAEAMGMVIGKKGEKILSIERETMARLQTSRTGKNAIEIFGTPEQIESAEQQVLAIVKSYEAKLESPQAFSSSRPGRPPRRSGGGGGGGGGFKRKSSFFEEDRDDDRQSVKGEAGEGAEPGSDVVWEKYTQSRPEDIPMELEELRRRRETNREFVMLPLFPSNLREEIWNWIRANPSGWTLDQISEKFQVNKDHMKAIIALLGPADDFRARNKDDSILMSTELQDAMEALCGTAIPKFKTFDNVPRPVLPDHRLRLIRFDSDLANRTFQFKNNSDWFKMLAEERAFKRSQFEPPQERKRIHHEVVHKGKFEITFLRSKQLGLWKDVSSTAPAEPK